jgi:ribosomal protein S18 acetylase RimI-like enzyme
MRKKSYLTALFLCSTIGLGLFFYFRNADHIYPFDEKKHTLPILELFEKDRYWLSATPNYSAVYMLKYRAKDWNLSSINKLKLNVLEENGNFVGFTGYHLKENPEIGKILFLAINKEYRGKRYGEKLARYAINQLVKMGAKIIVLSTRVENHSAQNLYRRMGFIETGQDNTFMHFEYMPESAGCAQSPARLHSTYA